MKRLLSYTGVGMLMLVFVLASCSKYEEGSPSLASKKSRLVNHWKVVSITANGVDITSWNLINELYIRDNNTITVIGEPFGVYTENDGGWVFNSKKTHVLVTNNDGSLDSYEIVKLEKDSFKVRITDENGTTLLHEYETY